MVNEFKIYFKSSENMSEVDSNAVKTVITSPPYWDLKNYLVENQIGYNEKYDEYHNRLNKVWKECYRILKENGSIWINITFRFYEGKLYLIPFDIINNMENLGFIYLGAFIWHKPSGIPSSSKNLSNHFEYILFFVKNTNKFKFNDNELWNDDYGFLGNGKIGNVWRIVKKAGTVGKEIPHPAIYPNELVERIIKITSKENDVILDPFLGSGTTLISSVNINRRFKGYEINDKEYKKIIKLRIESELKNELTRYL